jgi:hypothetical protein
VRLGKNPIDPWFGGFKCGVFGTTRNKIRFDKQPTDPWFGGFIFGVLDIKKGLVW